jgi:hypothetical protein
MLHLVHDPRSTTPLTTLTTSPAPVRAMATTGTHNYAQQLGIHNHWAPIVFAIFYFFVFLYNVFRSIRNHGSANVYRGLALFALSKFPCCCLVGREADQNALQFV